MPRQRSIVELIQGLDCEGEIEPRSLIVELGRHGEAATVHLQEAVRHHPSCRVRRWACEALSLVIGKQALPNLIAATRDQHMSVRLHALIALSEYHDDRVIPVITELMQDPSGGIRSNAVVAARLHLERYDALLRHLVAAAKDDKWYVRKEVARALRGHNSVSAQRTLTKLRRDAHPTVRKTAGEPGLRKDDGVYSVMTPSR